MQAAELMVRCLESEGVERIYAIPGEETLEIVEALRDSSIEIVIVRHEQGAAFMADVHGRLTGRAGVCLGTLGPGATNLITGIGDAYLDYAPMVAITGQVRLDLVHKESHQYVDVVDMLRPVTKWNARIERPETVPEVVRKAFKVAEAERPGPTHLELSETIAAAELPDSSRPLATSDSGPSLPDPAVVREAAEIIRSARRPVIISGNGVIRAGASPELRALCAHAGIPACPTFMGKGALDDRSLLSLPAVGLQARDSMTAGLDEADVVICVGYDLVEFGPAGWNPRMLKRIIHVDARPAEVDQSYIPEVEIVAGVRETLQALREELPAAPEPSYVARLRVAVDTELRATAERPGFVSPQAAISAIRARDGAVGHPHLGRRRPQAVAGAALSGLRAQHGHRGQRLRQHGHRPARGDRGHARGARAARGGGVGRRRLPDERPGDGDRHPARRPGHRGGLGGRRLRGDRLEAGAPLRAHPRHPLRQPRLRRPGPRLRLEPPPRHRRARPRRRPAPGPSRRAARR